MISSKQYKSNIGSKSTSVLLSILLAVCLVLSSFAVNPAFADTAGYVNVGPGDSLNVRSGPGINNAYKFYLDDGEEVTITGEANDPYGDKWYSITSSKGSGYVYADYIAIGSKSDQDNIGSGSSGSSGDSGSGGSGSQSGSGSSGTDYQVEDMTATVTVRESYTRVRSGPGTDYSILYEANAGRTLSVIGSTTGSDGYVWYKLSDNGFIRSDLVSIYNDVPYVTDGDFEAFLTAQGFPESYKPYLRSLHAKYPNWKFVANHTGLNWADVVYAETHPVSRSLVESYMPDTWKSTAQSAYNLNSGSYTVYDSGGWVAASEAIVAYYLDPRTQLTETAIFQFLSNKYDAGTQTKANLLQVIGSSYLSYNFPESSYPSYADLIIAAGSENGVNPLTIASMIISEQGYTGYGGSISGTEPGYEGYYNHFNIGAYAHSGRSAVTNGLIHAMNQGWNSRTASIKGGTAWFARNYVNENQYNVYLQKFNVMNGSSAVGTYQYMTCIYGANIEGGHIAKGYSGMLSSSITFDIPVYHNMPESACPAPKTSGNNIKYLNSLGVTGYTLTPTFGPYNTNYELVVPAGTSSVSITASPYSSSANIAGTGTVTLDSDSKTVQVVCTSSGGEALTYNIKITRQKGSGGGGSTTPEPPAQEIAPSTNKYTLSDYVSGVAIGTSYSNFIANFNLGTGSIKVFTSSVIQVTDGIIGTGMILKLYNSKGEELSSSTIVVRGDNNGDGKVNSLDALRVQKHSLGTITLAGAYLSAADATGDGKVNSLDALRIQKYSLGSATISAS